MRAKNRKGVTFPEVADELNRWAKSRLVERDAYVLGLSDALRTGENLSFWAQHPPMEWLPRPESLAASRIASWARLISITRNVLIFLPVALTWYAIGQATKAFNIYLDSGADTTANFLVFWQDGKGILDEKWRIGEVATLDFQIIMGLVVLTFFSGLLQARSLRLSNKEFVTIEKERIDISLRIDTVLNPYRISSDETNAQTLAALLERLTQVTQTLGTVSEEFLKATKTIDPKMKQSLVEIRKTSAAVSRSATRMQKSSVLAQQTVKQLRATAARKSK